MNDGVPFAPVGCGTARFSLDGRYRYELARRWGRGPAVTFIMLNPSTAGAGNDDPTVRRCVRYVRDWGYGALVVVNLFAVCGTDPACVGAHDAVGPDNDEAIHDAVVRSRVVVAAWGATDCRGRDKAVLEDLDITGRPILCLGTTRSGAPKHPLYLRRTAPLIVYA